MVMILPAHGEGGGGGPASLVTRPWLLDPPLAKRSGAPSQNVEAYSRNAVRSNEIAGFVIITFWNAITER